MGEDELIWGGHFFPPVLGLFVLFFVFFLGCFWFCFLWRVGEV